MEKDLPFFKVIAFLFNTNVLILTGFGCTVICFDAEYKELLEVAVMVTTPGLIPVTIPSWLMVAIYSMLLLQIKGISSGLFSNSSKS